MTTSDAELARVVFGVLPEQIIESVLAPPAELVEPLTDEQVWWRPNHACNSVGNLLLHLNGNVGQWLIAAFNGLEDTRNRPAEFNERRRIAGKVLLQRLECNAAGSRKCLDRLTPRGLAATYHIQGYTVRGLDAVYQVVEHFGLHYGQILYINKLLRGEDLGFYRELNLTGRAS